jgi:large conductance mechanosensitive channel
MTFYLGPTVVNIAPLLKRKRQARPLWTTGPFFNVLLDFLIVAFAVFMLVRQVNRLKRVEKLPEATSKACPFYYSNIATRATRFPQCTSALAAG